MVKRKCHIRHGLICAATIGALTAAVGAAALAGFEHFGILGYILWPGGFLAFAWRGDDYTGLEFLTYAAVFAVCINAVLGFIMGVMGSVVVGWRRNR